MCWKNPCVHVLLSKRKQGEGFSFKKKIGLHAPKRNWTFLELSTRGGRRNTDLGPDLPASSTLLEIRAPEIIYPDIPDK